MVVVYKFCTGNLEKCLEKSITSMTDVSNGLYQHLNEETFRTMVEILYSTPKLTREIIRNCAILCHQPIIPLKNRKYLMSIIGLSLQKTTPSLEVEDYINFILTVVIGHSLNDLNHLNSEQERSISSWSLLNLYYDASEESLIDYAIVQLRILNNYHLLWEKLMSPIGKFLAMFRQLPISAAHGIVKLLSKLSEWRKEGGVDNIEDVTVNSEINQIADLLSAVLLYTVSETYNSSHGKRDRNNSVEDELICSTISLLSNHDLLLRQLVKKWINIVREYDMDACCVISIAEVLMALIHEPVLSTSLRDLKSELLSITNIQMKAATRFDGVAVLQQLKFILTQSWS